MLSYLSLHFPSWHGQARHLTHPHARLFSHMTYGRDVRDNWEVEGFSSGSVWEICCKGEEGRQQRSTCGALHGECGEA